MIFLFFGGNRGVGAEKVFCAPGPYLQLNVLKCSLIQRLAREGIAGSLKCKFHEGRDFEGFWFIAIFSDPETVLGSINNC